MILSVHLIFGVAIGSIINNIPLAIISAFLSHYILDIIPHVDYPIKNGIKNKILAGIGVLSDICVGVLLILMFAENKSITYICGFFALLPDGLTIINYLFPNRVLEVHQKFHEKVHFFKNKKISIFWRVLSQVIIILVSIAILKF